jgi:hypothetical protein
MLALEATQTARNTNRRRWIATPNSLLEVESAEAPRLASGGGSAPRSVNDTAPVSFDGGRELPERNPLRRIGRVQRLLTCLESCLRAILFSLVPAAGRQLLPTA